MNYKTFDGFVVAVILLGVAATATAVVRQNSTDFLELTPPVEALSLPIHQTSQDKATTTDTTPTIKPSIFTVKIGESFIYNNTEISFIDVVTDSRCPKDVVCVWAGEFIARFTLKTMNDIELLTLKNTVTSASALYDMHITKITPDSIAQKNINQKEYTVTLSIGLKK